MRYILLLFILLVAAKDAVGQKERKQVRAGNKEYRNIQFGDSELSYRRALDADPGYSDASFNLGNSLYKQKKYEDAQERFGELSSSELDRRARSESFYNLGNSLLKSDKVEESIEAYKNSLRLKPDNPEAKYNLAYAQDLLQQQQDQQNGQQQENGEQNDQQQQQDKNDQQDRSEQEQQQNEQKMTREDAERLLQALANNEQEVQEKVKKEKAAKMRVRTLKNW